MTAGLDKQFMMLMIFQREIGNAIKILMQVGVVGDAGGA